MTRTILGEHAKTEIRDSIKRCRNRKEIAAEADRLSKHFKVGKDRIYAITKDLRPKQKTRADKGSRAVDLKTDPELKLVVGWVETYGVTTAEALNLAKERGMNVPIQFPTLNRYLKEAGLDRKARRNPQTPHRRFEASAPGEMFQFDISGLKERWFDHTTRRIISVSPLEVSKNHENTKVTRVRVWRFSLIDDFSRREFIRYVPVAKPNSSHVVDFLLQAYAELGVPHKLYTDNDVIIKFGRNQRATEILGKVLSDQGGYENVFHLPGNARATGKVERLHQSVEQDEKFIGLYLAERGELTIDVLNNQFAVSRQNRKNNTVHRETGETPMQRWESTLSVIRRLDYESLRSAFMVDEFLVKLRGDLTFRLKGSSYQLPTGEQYPFGSWIGQKLRVVFPDSQPFFTVVGLDGMEYDIAKEASAPDAAGDFKSTAQTSTEQLRKEVRAIAKADAKRNRAAAEAPAIPFFDNDFAQVENTNVTRFPKPETVIEPAAVAEVAPGRGIDIHDRQIHFWEAFNQFLPKFEGDKAACKAFMDSIFESRNEECWLLLAEVEAAVESRTSTAKPVRHLKAV